MTNITLEEQLQNHGLKLLSVIQQDSMLTSGQNLVLIGNSSKGMWPAFSQSEEYKLGKSNPLDRWSQRLGQQLANQYDGRAIYPFTGPPYQPFLSWAQHNGDSFQSHLDCIYTTSMFSGTGIDLVSSLISTTYANLISTNPK